MIPAIIAGGLALGGALFGAIGRKRASDAREAQAEQEAMQLTRARDMAVGDIRRSARAAGGGIRLAAGASGVKIDSGSPLATLSQSYANAERDILRTKLQYQMQIDQRKNVARSERKTRWWNFGGDTLAGGFQAAGMFV